MIQVVRRTTILAILVVRRKMHLSRANGQVEFQTLASSIPRQVFVLRCLWLVANSILHKSLYSRVCGLLQVLFCTSHCTSVSVACCKFYSAQVIVLPCLWLVASSIPRQVIVLPCLWLVASSIPRQVIVLPCLWLVANSIPRQVIELPCTCAL